MVQKDSEFIYFEKSCVQGRSTIGPVPPDPAVTADIATVAYPRIYFIRYTVDVTVGLNWA